MHTLSLEIIIFITSGISLTMGLYMLILYNSVRHVKGPAYWAAGNLMIGLGVLLRLVNPVNGFLDQAVSMAVTTIGLYVYLAGIWNFKEKEIKRWLIIGFPALDILQSVVFYYIFPLSQVRLVIHILVLSVFAVISIYEMLHLNAETKYLRKIFRLNAISFAAFLIILIGGLVMVFIHPQHEVDRQFVWIIAFGIAGGLMTAITFGFLSAVNLQLNKELVGQLKTKTKFFSIITHDLRGPVGTLMAFVNLLNNQRDLDEEQRLKVMENLEVLSQSTFHLLQNLLEWANTSGNITRFEEELIDLNQMIISDIKFFQSLTSLKSIRLEFQHDKDVFINGNPKMIETVIRNLVSNAIKFTPKEGLITITLRKDEKEVHLTVADTGVGIEPERLDQIFKMDNIRITNGTNGESGSGLGLALCKDFVTRNRGTIRVESDVKVGSRFIIDFPVAG